MTTTATISTTALQLRSLVQPDGTLQISLESTPMPTPGPDEVLIQVQATPINPSDIGLLLGPADLSTVQVTGTADRPVATTRIPERAMPGMAARVGQSMPVGNEGAGLVVAAGASPAAQALLGRTVAVIGGAMYTQHHAAVPAERQRHHQRDSHAQQCSRGRSRHGGGEQGRHEQRGLRIGQVAQQAETERREGTAFTADFSEALSTIGRRPALEQLDAEIDQVGAAGQLEAHVQRGRGAEQRLDSQAAGKPPDHRAAGNSQGGDESMATRMHSGDARRGEEVRPRRDHRHGP